MRIIIGAAIAAAMLLPATAQAATKTYAGTTEGGGVIALDVKVSHKGVVRKITEARGAQLPTVCEQSGKVPSHLTFPDPIEVKRNGKFADDYAQPTYGNVSMIGGKFKGKKKVSGTIDVDFHFPAEDGYPEENCSTGPIDFQAKAGKKDETGDMAG